MDELQTLAHYWAADFSHKPRPFRVGVIDSRKNGKSSIQIDGLLKELNNTIFKNKKEFTKKYLVEEENGRFKNFHLVIIMDLDDTTDENIRKYKNKDMFKKHWLAEYIVPIWNDRNLDEVILALNLTDVLPNYRNKGKAYGKLFSTNYGGTDKQRIEELMHRFKKSNKTNLDECLKICLDAIDC